MTQLNQVFEGVIRLGVDSAPLIYFVERHPTYVHLMRQIIGYIDTGAIFGYSSVVTLTEVLIQPKRVGNNSLQDQYRDLLLHSRNFNLLSVNAAMAESAADLRVRYNLRTPDALQIATALAADCQAFLTNDLDLKRVSELQILVLEELVSVTQG